MNEKLHAPDHFRRCGVILPKPAALCIDGHSQGLSRDPLDLDLNGQLLRRRRDFETRSGGDGLCVIEPHLLQGLDRYAFHRRDLADEGPVGGVVEYVFEPTQSARGPSRNEGGAPSREVQGDHQKKRKDDATHCDLPVEVIAMVRGPMSRQLPAPTLNRKPV